MEETKEAARGTRGGCPHCRLLQQTALCPSGRQRPLPARHAAAGTPRAVVMHTARGFGSQLWLTASHRFRASARCFSSLLLLAASAHCIGFQASAHLSQHRLTQHRLTKDQSRRSSGQASAVQPRCARGCDGSPRKPRARRRQSRKGAGAAVLVREGWGSGGGIGCLVISPWSSGPLGQ